MMLMEVEADGYGDLIKARERLATLLVEHYQPDERASVVEFLERFSDLFVMIRVANIFIIAAKHGKDFKGVMDIIERNWRYVWYDQEKGKFFQPFVDGNKLLMTLICNKLGIPLLDPNTVWRGSLRVVTIDSEYVFTAETVGWRSIVGREKLPVIVKCIGLGKPLVLFDPGRKHSDVSGIVILVERLLALPER